MREIFTEKNIKIGITSILGILLITVGIVLWLRPNKAITEYMVTFDSNGGSEVEPLMVKETEKASIPADPIREGYIFAGWYEYSNLFDFDTEITKDITLTARWTSDQIELSNSILNLEVGQTEKLKISSLPEGIQEEDLIITSSDVKIVDINENGELKALKAGTVTITVETEDKQYSTTCEVTVLETIIEVESISISGSSTVTVGNTLKLSASIKPNNATHKDVTWKSSDTSILTVDRNGNVKGIKAGTATVTVTSSNQKTAKKTITVKANSNQNNPAPSPSPEPTPTTKPVTDVKISGDTEVYVGESIQLSVEINPDDATNKNVSWKSNNDNIATVENGKVTGKSQGEVTITVTTEDGGKMAEHHITVKEKEEEKQEDNAIYYLHLQKMEMSGTGAVSQYKYYVTKNNNRFQEYKVLILNGDGSGKGTYKPGDENSTISANDVNVEGTNNAVIILLDGSTKELLVTFN